MSLIWVIACVVIAFIIGWVGRWCYTDWHLDRMVKNAVDKHISELDSLSDSIESMSGIADFVEECYAEALREQGYSENEINCIKIDVRRISDIKADVEGDV